MKSRFVPPPATVCVLTYGDHSVLARRCLESIRRQTERSLYRLVVGGNAVSKETESYLRGLRAAGHIDRLILSRRNLNKCPMMRRMFRGLETKFIFWFDDDSSVSRRGVLEAMLAKSKSASKQTVMWGQMAYCEGAHDFINITDMTRFVRESRWYRGLTPPSWAIGGKGEFDFQGRGTGDGRWFFITGGFWLIRTEAVRALDWPDRRLLKLGDDVLLGEAIRQQGWKMCNTGSSGVRISRERRRGDAGLLGVDPV